MKIKNAIILCFLLAAGCSAVMKVRYEQQVAELDKKLCDGDISYFQGADIWGRKWKRIDVATQNTNDHVWTVCKYISSGENLVDDRDDINVWVHQAFDNGVLIAWGYSYIFEINGGVISGGYDFDM